jgi:hypothetical protein
MATLAKRGYNPQWLKDTFLLGVDLTLDDGSPYPDRVFSDSLEHAERAVALELGLIIEPQVISERHDKEPDAHGGWFPIRTRHRPLINVETLAVSYGQSSTRAELPPEWATITESIAGQIHIIPVAEGASSYLVSGGLPVLVGMGSLTAHYYVPAYFELEYLAGFPFYEGVATIPAGQNSVSVPTPYKFTDAYTAKATSSNLDVYVNKKRFDTFTVSVDQNVNVDTAINWQIDTLPADIAKAIGLQASLLALDIAGDLIVGAGIGSMSTSLDGLSQSIQTTASATNSGYGSRVLQFQKELKALMSTLKATYRALNIMSL